MKSAWKQFAAAREAARNLAHLSSIGGRISYVSTDVTDGAAVDAAVARVVSEYGRIDMVLFGAGTQSSRLLSRRTLAEFRKVTSTKLAGIGNVERACLRHMRGEQPHFQILGSAAGVAGNPGQADYVAANEALSRLAAWRSYDGAGSEWACVAWLGWDGVGMGVDYVALARADRDSWLSRFEGKSFFLQLMEGRPVAPQIAAMRTGARLRALEPEAPSRGDRATTRTWPLALDTHRFLSHHKVDGTPTVPGAYLVDLAVRAAAELRPGLRATRVEAVRIDRFVKVYLSRSTVLRAVARIAFEDRAESAIRVSLTTDIVHSSGRMLRRDVRVMSALVVLAVRVPGPEARTIACEASGAAIELPEPYRHPLSRVQVGGPFHGLSAINVTENLVTASFQAVYPQHRNAVGDTVIPVVPLDALFRISGYQAPGAGTIPIFAPTHCGRVDLPAHAVSPTDKLSMRAGLRCFDADRLHTEWAEILEFVWKYNSTCGRNEGAADG